MSRVKIKMVKHRKEYIKVNKYLPPYMRYIEY